jgi:pyruvate dehydrogenase E1 component beta subunit
MPQIAYREALNQAMVEEMERDDRIFLMGEEVGHYNGAYKVSKGMLEKFGERRVLDTPIAENGFAGIGIGAAMAGLRPIVEFMTWNFSFVAADQLISNAAKIRQMSAGQFTLPIVFRGPGGSAHMLAAQHSQSTEALWAHVPGLKVVMPANPYDAKGLLKSALRDNNPIVFIEGEIMYGDLGEVPEGEYLIPLGVGDVKREGKHITIVAWSKMVKVALGAAAELAKEGIEVEVVDPRTIRPLDEELIVSSVSKTGRALIVEEGWPFNGVGAEIAYRIARRCFDDLDAPVERLTGADMPMPYNHHLEELCVPTIPRAVAAVKKLLYLED